MTSPSSSHSHVVTSIESFKALAHPTRLAALAQLRRTGPATATELARELGESSGSLSYHLRQLARYGFVADDAARDARERRWRATAQLTEWGPELTASAEGHEALRIVRGVQRQHLSRQLDALQSETDPGFDHSDYLLKLDTADAIELTARIGEIVRDYLDRDGERLIALHVLALPADEQ